MRNDHIIVFNFFNRKIEIVKNLRFRIPDFILLKLNKELNQLLMVKSGWISMETVFKLSCNFEIQDIYNGEKYKKPEQYD